MQVKMFLAMEKITADIDAKLRLFGQSVFRRGEAKLRYPEAIVDLKQRPEFVKHHIHVAFVETQCET